MKVKNWKNTYILVFILQPSVVNFECAREHARHWGLINKDDRHESQSQEILSWIVILVLFHQHLILL